MISSCLWCLGKWDCGVRFCQESPGKWTTGSTGEPHNMGTRKFVCGRRPFSAALTLTIIPQSSTTTTPLKSFWPCPFSTYRIPYSWEWGGRSSSWTLDWLTFFCDQSHKVLEVCGTDDVTYKYWHEFKEVFRVMKRGAVVEVCPMSSTSHRDWNHYIAISDNWRRSHIPSCSTVSCSNYTTSENTHGGPLWSAVYAYIFWTVRRPSQNILCTHHKMFKTRPSHADSPGNRPLQICRQKHRLLLPLRTASVAFHDRFYIQ